MSGKAGTDWKRADARHHDREADRYDALIGREYAPYQAYHTAEPWARLLAGAGARFVLDIGGGTGRTALPIAAAGPTVVIVDSSRGMLRRARRSAAGLRRGNVRLVVGDAEELPFGEQAFDAVVCQGVLHHLPDVGAALGEADRVLANRGWLCLAEPDRSGSALSRWMRSMFQLLRPAAGLLASRRSPAAEKERPLAMGELADALAAAGYAVSVAWLVHPPVVYRFLPERTARRLAYVLNRRSTARQGGDMALIEARKAATGVPVRLPENGARRGAHRR